MAKRYFCDRCGKEATELSERGYPTSLRLVAYAGDSGNPHLEVCKQCYTEYHAMERHYQDEWNRWRRTWLKREDEIARRERGYGPALSPTHPSPTPSTRGRTDAQSPSAT
jgi:hypothetical protein